MLALVNLKMLTDSDDEYIAHITRISFMNLLEIFEISVHP